MFFLSGSAVILLSAVFFWGIVLSSFLYLLIEIEKIKIEGIFIKKVTKKLFVGWL